MIRSTVEPRVFIIPRRATNVFYNTTSPGVGAQGSEPDEYNYFFGPNGLYRVGGPGGPPFFAVDQTYQQIVDRESDALVTYMFRYELYPSMYHQANFYFYDNQHTLFTDVIDAALTKFKQMSNLPVSDSKTLSVTADSGDASPAIIELPMCRFGPALPVT